MHYAIFAYGSPRISLGNLSVLFPSRDPAGKIWFEEIKEEFETLSGDLIILSKGLRAYATLKLSNFRSSDAERNLSLIHILNTSRRTGAPMLLQPRYNGAYSLGLRVILSSNFGYEEITNLDAGQTLEITFKTKSLLDEYPGFIHSPEFLKIADTGYLLLSSEGGRLILPARNYVDIDPGADIAYEEAQ